MDDETKDMGQAKVRLPANLKNWLQHQALDNRRSFNAELIVRLEQSRDQQQTRQTQGAAQ